MCKDQMKIAFIGVCKKNNGPSNVNKGFLRHLSKCMHFSESKYKVLRLIETVISTLKADVVIISGLSAINNCALICARITKKPVVYIMHGCYTFEAEINQYKLNGRSVKYETAVLQYALKIIAVSERYMDWAKEHFPEFSNKFTYINNGIEWSDYTALEIRDREPYMLLAMGGGRPQKNNLIICKAVRILNEKYMLPFEFVVLGNDCGDTDAIKNSPYTQYVGQVSRDELRIWLARASIYIQNSSFESFGLAPIEALCSGCNLLISQNVGAISIMNSIEECDIINDCNNPEEIAGKIIHVFKNANNKRLLAGIDHETTSCKYASERLIEIVKEVCNKDA